MIFYHIDTALMSLTQGHLMYNPEAFSKDEKKIWDVGGNNTIPIPQSNMIYFIYKHLNW